MPATMIPSFAKRSGKSEKEVERLWHKAKDLAVDGGHSEEYDYIVGILKRMLKLEGLPSFSEHLIFEDFMSKVYKEIAEIVQKELKTIYTFYADDEYGDDYIKEIITKDYIIKVYDAPKANGKKVYKYNFTFAD